MIASQLGGAAFGIEMEKGQNRRQIEQQKRLQELQIQGNKEMTDYQKMKELEMWRNTSYPAQMAMMKEAGLNPSLMYGMGGGGGTTVGGGGAGVSGASASGSSGQGIAGAQMGLQMKAQTELLQAQKENIEADTANKQGDTANKPKVGANLDASTASLTQGIENQRAQERLTVIQGYIADTELEIKGKTKEDAIRLVSQEVEMADNEIRAMKRENWVDDATAKDRIGMVRARLAGALLENLLTDAKISLTKEETMAIGKRLSQGWEGLYQQGVAQGEQRRASENNRRMNDVTESEKVPIEILEKVAQAIGLGAGIRGAKGGDNNERFKEYIKTRQVFGNDWKGGN